MKPQESISPSAMDTTLEYLMLVGHQYDYCTELRSRYDLIFKKYVVIIPQIHPKKLSSLHENSFHYSNSAVAWNASAIYIFGESWIYKTQWIKLHHSEYSIREKLI